MEGVNFSRQERTGFALRALYERAGYAKFQMSRFEELGLYLDNRYFLSSDRVISFTDADGRLLALKPDVTLSIVKGARGARGETERLYYAESVFRPGRDGEGFREIAQMGLERIGVTDNDALREVALMATESLKTLSPGGILIVNHMGFALALADELRIPQDLRTKALALLSAKNVHGLRALLPNGEASALCALTELSGSAQETLRRAEALVRNASMQAALATLQTLCRALPDVHIDLAMLNDTEYYNGVIFAGYLPGAPRPVLAGGQYDALMRKFHKEADGIGFAVYLDELPAKECAPASGALTVALPKGRLGEAALEKLRLPKEAASGRRLSWEAPERGLTFLWVKPGDVPVYVERGAADVGVAGKDVLMEQHPEVYELADLGFGKCRMCVAARAGFCEDTSRALRVATKFPRVAKAHFAQKGREIEVIKLNGSIELAPLLGLSDVIVDIVESGGTLRENGLVETESFLDISARLIAGKAGYAYKRARIRALMDEMGGVLA